VEQDYRDVLGRYREHLAPVTEDFFGNYILVVYDHHSDRVAVVPDRPAVSAVYYSVSSLGIVASNRAAAVASLTGAAIDGQSLIALMRGMHMPFGHSLFAGVHRVMCGCYLDIDLRKHTIACRRWHPLYRPIAPLGFSDCVDATASSLRAVVGVLTSSSGRAAFDLTGGNDTRLLAAAVDAVYPDAPPRSVTWRVAGEEADMDVFIARRIATLCKWPLSRLDRYPATDEDPDRLIRLAVQADGSFTIDVVFSRLEQELAECEEPRALVGAIGGELLRGFFWRHEMLALGRTSKVNYSALLAYRLSDAIAFDPRRLGQDAPGEREHDEVILAPYRRLADAGRDVLNPYKLDVMYLHKLCYSAGNAQSWMTGLRCVKLPLLSSEAILLALTFPWRWRATRRLILRTIAQLSPRLASIPNDKQEPMIPLDWMSWPFYTAAGFRLGSRTVRRMLRRYTGRGAPGLTVRTMPPPASWVATLTQNRLLRSAVDPSFIHDVIGQATARQQAGGAVRSFYGLLSVELLLRGVPNISGRIDYSAPDARLEL
jgi:hypothetical protein